MRLGWFTNCWKSNREDALKDLLLIPGRVIMEGNPKATDTYSVDELIKMGVIGLYDVDPSMADQCHGFERIHVSDRKAI